MRKKLLRSRSGFEKPESREEAIMQNILGASNVLEPSESNIEEILKSILYNTPYTKEPETNIEEILLAIKNNGTYTGECESRDMKILFAILNELTYNEEPESQIEELFIEWLYQRSSIKVLEGVPPLTFTSRGLPLINYLIEGNTVQNGTPIPANPVDVNGVGERTGNLCPRTYKNNWGINVASKSVYITSDRFAIIIPVEPNTDYTISRSEVGGSTYFVYGLSLSQPNNNTVFEYCDRFDYAALSQTVNSQECNYLTIFFGVALSPDIMVNTGSTPLPYEPYGYKIPISNGQQTANIYLGSTQTVRAIKKVDLASLTWTWNNTSKLYSTKELTDILYTGTNWEMGKGIAEKYKMHIGSGMSNVSADGCIAIDVSMISVHSETATLPTGYFWYALRSPETTTVNEPLMKIGDYADTLSMEQAGVEIPTVNGSNTLDVDTTLKPSNIYIEYK